MLIPKGTQAVYVGDTIGWEHHRGSTAVVASDAEIKDEAPEIGDDGHVFEDTLPVVFEGESSKRFVYLSSLCFAF